MEDDPVRDEVRQILRHEFEPARVGDQDAQWCGRKFWKGRERDGVRLAEPCGLPADNPVHAL